MVTCWVAGLGNTESPHPQPLHPQLLGFIKNRASLLPQRLDAFAIRAVEPFCPDIYALASRQPKKVGLLPEFSHVTQDELVPESFRLAVWVPGQTKACVPGIPLIRLSYNAGLPAKKVSTNNKLSLHPLILNVILQSVPHRCLR
jgi:hypothetical protein